MMSGMKKQRQITQHKRFAIAHPNFCFAETSFMLESLGENTLYTKDNIFCKEG